MFTHSLLLIIFTELSGLTSGVDELQLLLEELHIEVLLRVSFLKKCLKVLFVRITCHEGRRAATHEDLGELSVFLLDDVVKHLVVLLEEWLDKVNLLVAAPEASELLLRLEDGIL